MSLRDFFNPSSVAVIGASRDGDKVGSVILAAMIRSGFDGAIYPVNPKADEIQGLKCYPDLASIGEAPGLAVIAVPAKFVPAVMEDCANAGVKAAVIITAGFREVGDEGLALERKVIEIARRAKMRVIGPNCLGVMSSGDKLNASFAGDLPVAGSIGCFSQSGALMTAILDMAKARGMGFSKLVSIGNKADVTELDVLRALGADPATRVIVGYLESITRGDAFVREAEQISQEKPVLLMKSGGTGAGSQAASSHTGSLAGDEAAYECVFERAGIIRCGSITEQFDFAQAFADQPLPAGSRIAVVTNAGGPGIMAADAVERQDLEFAQLTEETMSTLAAALPAAANVRNPVDVLGDARADRYELALDAVLRDPNVDVAVVLLTPQAMTEGEATAGAVTRLAAEHGKPVFACFMGGPMVEAGKVALREGGVPNYDSPESAVAVIKVMADYVRWRARPKRVVKMFPVNRRKVEQIIGRSARRGETEIGEAESKEILEAYGFLTPKGAVAGTADQAVSIADRLGYPVVMKIWSPDISHKSDLGGVKVGLKDAQQVRDAFDLMMYRIPPKAPDASILGVLVQEMCSSGQEVILGMRRDAQFGPIMMFGMGGTLVETLKDVAFYLAPLTADEAKTMLMNTKTYRLLQGVRGQEGVDIDAVAEGLQRLSQLVTEFPQIVEMDINPYVLGPEGTTSVAVDARISIRKTDEARHGK
jgi:acetate---CoA ligase (ADP-forming)